MKHNVDDGVINAMGYKLFSVHHPLGTRKMCVPFEKDGRMNVLEIEWSVNLDKFVAYLFLPKSVYNYPSLIEPNIYYETIDAANGIAKALLGNELVALNDSALTFTIE